MKIPAWVFPKIRLSHALGKDGFSVRRTDYLGIDDRSRWAVVKDNTYVGEILRKNPFGELTYRSEWNSLYENFINIASQFAKRTY